MQYDKPAHGYEDVYTKFVAINETAIPIVVIALNATNTKDVILETATFDSRYAVYGLNPFATTCPIIFNCQSAWHTEQILAVKARDDKWWKCWCKAWEEFEK